ncbi:RNA polymerase factor sigma-32 [Elstera cyanobacteriorum]|uniref:RNA polymerase sigma factor n=1 Tax=Elstera cyanobacteriorum TaxID=2022747 RepID=A0A255XSG0_9PROT|nr:RNA polymerase factor sigma-32 [Elstera cyanobacteriorum]MCK6441732.1 RNA polymerase factor sigma-32 [Elstera cyanobacteriorum]OYQ19919.1 RNA polymerase factor sigma-32 [Elstera cyanobacteriorum]GFZ96543.1 RNA polymerase factor sigma-32 [Elstera cyanobacteriorum]
MTHIDDVDTQRANLGFVRRSMAAPLLSREEEFALARRWREHQDERALHSLVRAYGRLVVAMAARFRRYGLPVGDLVQEGNVGLMQAAARFDAGRDVRFSTYASWWIKAAMQDFVLRNWSIVRTGTTAPQKSLFFNLRRLRAKIEDASGQPLDDAGRAEIAETLNVSQNDVILMEQRLSGLDQSLNATISEEGEEEVQSFLPDPGPSPEEVVIGLRDAETRSKWLKEALDTLSPREQRIIRERRLSDQGVTLEQLGESLGVSKERVRQLENRALAKLREEILKHVEQPGDLMANA